MAAEKLTLQQQIIPITDSARLANLPDGNYQFGIRADLLQLTSPHENTICVQCTVDLAEISASETYLHVTFDGLSWVAQLSGIHNMHTQARIDLYFPIDKLFVFDANGEALSWPESRQGREG